MHTTILAPIHSALTMETQAMGGLEVVLKSLAVCCSGNVMMGSLSMKMFLLF